MNFVVVLLAIATTSYCLDFSDNWKLDPSENAARYSKEISIRQKYKNAKDYAASASIEASGNSSYRELKEIDADCYPLDSCSNRREGDSLLDFNCNCGEYCTDYNTCCINSPFREYTSRKVIPSCVPIYGRLLKESVFMVDQCKPDWTGDSSIENLCKGNAEQLNDPLLLIPVTNNKTLITYKNYFCAACNDETNLKYSFFWNMKLRSQTRAILFSDLPRLRYKDETSSWVIQDGGDNAENGVKVEILIPHQVALNVRACRSDVIAACASDWTDDVMRGKCGSYMALISVEVEDGDVKRYRNIHCAMCNHHNDFKRICSMPSEFRDEKVKKKKARLSFALLIDVNPSDGDVVGMIQKKLTNCGVNEMYDRFFEKCRKLKCSIPGAVIKNNECVKE